MRRIHAVSIVDPVRGALTGPRDIVIDRSGRIAAFESPTAGRPSDRSGLVAIPGLIDTHVHALGLLADVEPTPADLPWILRQQQHNLRAFLHAGVTTIRDLGAPLHQIRLISRLARWGWIASPRILCSGPVLTVTGGYPDFVPPLPFALEATLGPIAIHVRSLGHARSVVRSLSRDRVDCIKVMCQSAGYDDARSPLRIMPRPWRAAIIAEARRVGLPVVAHHIYLGDLLEDLDLPYDGLEHIPIDAPLPDEAVTRIAERRVPISTTMMTYGIIDHLDEFARLLEQPAGRFEPVPAAFLREMIHRIRTGGEVPTIGRMVIATGSLHQRESVRRLSQAKAVLVNGTDQGGAITPPGNPSWELTDMVRAGLTPAEAFRTATVDAARAIGRPDLGRLQPGCMADVVLLAPGSNPLERIDAIHNVTAVFKAGRLVYRNNLK